MRAAIFRNGDIVADTIADPRPSDGQVLVKTLCCGICGTDPHAAKYPQQFVERSRRAGGRWPMDPARGALHGPHALTVAQRCQQTRHDTRRLQSVTPRQDQFDRTARQYGNVINIARRQFCGDDLLRVGIEAEINFRHRRRDLRSGC